MIIDTESPEGRALVALAKFGVYTIANSTLWGDARREAEELGLIDPAPFGWYALTERAKLPEGL